MEESSFSRPSLRNGHTKKGYGKKSKKKLGKDSLSRIQYKLEQNYPKGEKKIVSPNERKGPNTQLFLTERTKELNALSVDNKTDKRFTPRCL